MVFDCYRPVRAVDDFVAWTGKADRPTRAGIRRSKRGDLIAEGYIGERSSHSRGSTVDLALGHIDADAATSLPDPDCGAEKTGTLEFGTGFDCFDPRSYTAHSPLPADAVANRKKLVAAMRAAGFRNYSHEWWHFTLRERALQEQRFDFPVTRRESDFNPRRSDKAR